MPAETRFCLSAKWTSPFKSSGASVQSTTGSQGVRISGSDAGYTMFRGSAQTGYPLHSPVSPSLPLLCVTVSHHISTGPYYTPVPSLTQMSWAVSHANHEECVLKIAVLDGAHSTTLQILLHIILPDSSSHGLPHLLCLCYMRESTVLFSCLTQGKLHGQLLHKTIIPTGRQHDPFNIQNN